MRFALVRYRAERNANGELLGYKPNVDFDGDTTWSCLDFKGEDGDETGVGLFGTTSGTTITGDVITDCGDNFSELLPQPVISKLSNEFGINFTSRRLGNVMAEAFVTLNHRDPLRWTGLRPERYSADDRGRYRIWCGSQPIYDEFGGMPDMQMAVSQVERFPTTVSSLTPITGMTLVWDVNGNNEAVKMSGGVNNSYIVCTNPGPSQPTSYGGYIRCEFDTGNLDLWVECEITVGNPGYTGLIIGVPNSETSNQNTLKNMTYAQLLNGTGDYYSWNSTPAYTLLGTTGLAATAGTNYRLRFQRTGSTCTAFRDSTAGNNVTTTQLTGTRGGVFSYDGSTAPISKFSVGGMYEFTGQSLKGAAPAIAQKRFRR